MGRKDGEAGSSGLVLLRSAKSPERNGPTAVLGEPALQLRLGGIVRQARHVQNLAALRQESANVSTGIHRPGKHIRMLMSGLRLANQAAQDTGKGDSFLHSTARRRRSKSLQMEGQVVLDGSAALDSLHLKSRADVSKRRGAERQRLGVMLLPSLVFGAQIESARMLQVGGKDNGLIAGFPRELDAQIPSLEGDENEVEVGASQVFGSKSIEAVDGIPEGTGVADMFPREGRQARCWVRGQQELPAAATRRANWPGRQRKIRG